MFMCLCAVYSITTFIRDMRTLLQIRQVAQLRSTTCNLSGLSSTQRSTQTTPSRDLTLGGKAREPPQTISPEVCASPPGKTERRGTLSGGFATMCKGHRTHGSTTMSFIAPCCKPHEHACSTNTSRHDTSRHTASGRPRCKSLHRNKHACRTDAGTHAT